MADSFEIVLYYVAWIFIWSLCFLIGLIATALRIYIIYIEILERRAESYTLDQIVPGSIKKNQPEKFIKKERVNIIAGVNPEVQPEECFLKKEEEQEFVKEEQAPSRHFYPRGLETTHDEIRKILKLEEMCTAARQEQLEILERCAEVKQSYALDQFVPGSIKKNQPEKIMKKERVNIIADVNPEVQPEESFIKEEEEQESVKEEQAGPSFEFDYLYDPNLGSRHFHPRGLETTHDEIRKILELEEMCKAARQELEILERRAEVKQSYELDQIVPGSIKKNQPEKFMKKERVNIIAGVNTEGQTEESFLKKDEEHESVKEEQAGPSFEYDYLYDPNLGSRHFHLRGLETTHDEIRKILELEAMCKAARQELEIVEKRAEVKQSYALDQIVPGSTKKFIKDEGLDIIAGVNSEVQSEENFFKKEEEQTVAEENKKVQESVKKEQAGPSRIKTKKPKRRDPSFEYDYLYDPYMGSRPFYPRGIETTHDEIRKMLDHEAICTAARQELRELDATRDKNRNRLDHDALCRAAQEELYFYNQRLQKSKQKRNK